MNISISITDNGTEDKGLTILRRAHNRSNGTSLTVKQFTEQVLLPKLILSQAEEAIRAKEQGIEVLSSYVTASVEVKNQIDALLRI